MRGNIQPLPAPQVEYDQDNERLTRRQIEQTSQDVVTDIDSIRFMSDGEHYLSTLAVSFLTMGASSG